MTKPVLRAVILVTLGVVPSGCARTVSTANTTPPSTDQIAQLWEMPQDLNARDLLHGPGGISIAPKGGAPFTWVATDSTGYSPGFDVRDAAGRSWNVKLGPEAQSEVVAS